MKYKLESYELACKTCNHSEISLRKGANPIGERVEGMKRYCRLHDKHVNPHSATYCSNHSERTCAREV